MLFNDIKSPLKSFNVLQGLSRSFKVLLQGPSRSSRSFKVLQGPSRSFKVFKVLQGLQGPSMT
jgi:hypothetical protein